MSHFPDIGSQPSFVSVNQQENCPYRSLIQLAARLADVSVENIDPFSGERRFCGLWRVPSQAGQAGNETTETTACTRVARALHATVNMARRRVSLPPYSDTPVGELSTAKLRRYLETREQIERQAEIIKRFQRVVAEEGSGSVPPKEAIKFAMDTLKKLRAEVVNVREGFLGDRWETRCGRSPSSLFLR